jgi:hypothetical protein
MLDLDFRLDAVVNMVPPGLLPGRCPGHWGYWQSEAGMIVSAMY